MTFSGTIDGCAAGIGCARRGRAAVPTFGVTLGRFPAAILTSSFSRTFIDTVSWRAEHRRREGTVCPSASLSDFHRDTLPLRIDSLRALMSLAGGTMSIYHKDPNVRKSGFGTKMQGLFQRYAKYFFYLEKISNAACVRVRARVLVAA